MKFGLRSASGLAIAAGLAAAAPAWGQQADTVQTTPQAQEQAPAAPVAQAPEQTPAAAPQAASGASDRVVVTGSLIAGASEDAPLAVDVYSAEELAQQGSPNVQEFVRSLAQSSETAGEIGVDGGPTTAGVSDVNLRGLGSSRTLTLLNGRRTSENTNNIPFGAIGRIEVLKDGAAVTYGAGAVAGVINFTTRRDIDGLEVSLERKMYEGSKGEYELSAVAGWVGDQSNFLLSGTYTHQDNLPFTKRSYGVLPYEVNPVQYTTTGSNPIGYTLPSGATALDYTPASCNAIGGYSRGAGQCYFAYTPFYDFINEEEITRVYSEFNTELNDSMEFHVEASYARTSDPSVIAAPTLFPNATHRAVLGTNVAASLVGGARMFQIPIVNAGVRNPFVDDFYRRAGQTAPASGNLYTNVGWRPFGQGGNSAYGYGGTPTRVERDFFQTSASLKGEFTEGALGFLSGVSYENSVTFWQTTSDTQYPDVITANLQNALRGYGGPNCQAVDDTPTSYASLAAYDATVGIQSATVRPGDASRGCYWFNPFASAIPANPFTGAPNPVFGGASYENSQELAAWLQADRGLETQIQNVTIDSVFSGTTPFIELPGGEIGWAVGGQWRTEENRGRVTGPSNLRALTRQACSWPDQIVGQMVAGVPIPVCPGDKPGPWFGLGDQLEDDSYTDQHVYSLFGELQIPVLDNLNFQVGARREVFGDIEGDIYKVAGKWDILPTLGVRGSYSTNFAAPPSNLRPGIPFESQTFVTRFTGTLPTTTTDAADIRPEEGTNMGAGVIWEPSFGVHDFRFSVDYFNIEVTDQITTTSITTIANSILPTGTSISTSLVNCASPLIANSGFVTLLGGACVQGVTTGSAITNVNLFQLNGPGQKTSGIDYSANYRAPIGPGALTASLSATQVLTYDVEGYSVNGVVFETGGDYLGFSNSSRSGDYSTEWRGNASVGYEIGAHMLRAQMNYIQGVTDEQGCQALAAPPGGVAPAPTCFGVFPEDYTDYDLHWRYQAEFMKDLELRLSVLNVTDEDPPARRARDGYYTRVTGARGRQVEIGLKKAF
jgi:iron complex outermembrane receptor protein